jgi:hypothetical protein
MKLFCQLDTRMKNIYNKIGQPNMYETPGLVGSIGYPASEPSLYSALPLMNTENRMRR